MTLLLLIAGFVALAYQVTALLAALIHKSRIAPPATPAPAVSILKPVFGLDEEFYEAIRSHAQQNYREFEILFGVHSADDAAVPAIERLMAEFPQVPIRLSVRRHAAQNGKVGVLMTLAEEAKHPLLLVNDSDILVPRDYLAKVASPLKDSRVGLVTCLYRAESSSLAGKWEALGIATDFIPSTLVAPLVGIREFGLGSTLCFRRTDLDSMGGFPAIADYIADDYQLARRITQLGTRAYLSEVVVSTHLSDPDWVSVWKHQVRWARTIRVSRGDGYLGLPVTHAGVWALLCFLGGLNGLAGLLILARIASGLAGGYGILKHREALLAFPLIPLWDFWAFTVWIAGLADRAVEWRGRRIHLLSDGRMVTEGESR